jgi:hypothetical protein
MSTRLALIAVGIVAAVIAIYLIISAIIGMLIWVAVLALLVLAIAGAIRLACRPTRTIPVNSKPVKGNADCAGERLSVGDTVRPGIDFDGPIDLAFGHGVIIKLGRGKAHVRFDENPARIHAITPTALRRM